MNDLDISEIMQKLQKMDGKLNEIQGDVNILSTLNKEKDKELLKNLIRRKFGQSDRKRLIWCHCNGEVQIEELVEKTEIRKSNLSPLTSEMSRQGLLVKEEKVEGIFCKKAEITKRIGLESEICKDLDL